MCFGWVWEGRGENIHTNLMMNAVVGKAVRMTSFCSWPLTSVLSTICSVTNCFNHCHAGLASQICFNSLEYKQLCSFLRIASTSSGFSESGVGNKEAR